MSENQDEESDTGSGESEGGGLEEGDFVRLEYTARVEDEDGVVTVVDTTDREVAEDEGLETEGREFGPRTIEIGAGHLFEDVEDAIVGSEVGYSDTITVASEEAFGEHDPDDVRTVSSNKIPEDDRYPGAQVELDGRHGFVETIIGGRARVDFNHPLAGQDVEYEFEVVGVVEDDLEMAAAVVENYTGVDVEVTLGTETKVETRVVEPDEDDTDDGAEDVDETDDGAEDVDEADEDEEAETEDGAEDADELDEDEEADSDDGAEDADDEDSGDETEEADAEPETVEEEVEVDVLYIEATPQLALNQQWIFTKTQVADDLMHRLDVDRVVVRETFDHSDVHAPAGMGGLGGMAGLGGAEGLDPEEVEEMVEDVEPGE